LCDHTLFGADPAQLAIGDKVPPGLAPVCGHLVQVFANHHKTLGKPVWRIVADMTPEEFVRCIDFRYITDAITPEEAISMLKEVPRGR
jgi:hypothetical protein